MTKCIMYHGISQKAFSGQVSISEFRRQIQGLQKVGHFVGLDEFMGRSQEILSVPRFLLTFDDGYFNNASLVSPVLEELGVPAIFFISTAHCESGGYLWFSHLEALRRHYSGPDLKIGSENFSFSAKNKSESIKSIEYLLVKAANHTETLKSILKTLPKLESYVPVDELEENFRGMTAKQIHTLSESPLFEIGAHTVNHLFLSKAEASEIKSEISGSKEYLERVTGKSVRCLAYPSGDYSEQVLRFAERQFEYSFSVYRGLGVNPQHEIQRFGVYNKSMSSLLFKIFLGSTLRKFGKVIG